MLILRDVKLGLQDLFDKRHADLLKSRAGAYYEPELRRVKGAIDGLPAELTGGAPLAEQLAEVDREHDGFGSSIFFATEVALRLPTATTALKDAAARVRATFIPALSELRAKYKVEADRAHERKPLLAQMKADLDLFPVPGGKTLFDIATLFIERGERLHTLLSARGDAPEANRAGAAGIRAEAIGVLGRLRDDLAQQVEADPALPRDLEHRVFGYFDTLASMNTKATPAAPAAPPPIEPPPVK